MTYEEQQQYNNLSYENRQEYDWIKSRHPSWTHKQIMTKVAFNAKEVEVIERNGGKDVDTEDPEIMSDILQGVKSFLIGIGLFIDEVFSAIDDALNALGNLIDAGISYVGNKLQEFWDWLWD